MKKIFLSVLLVWLMSAASMAAVGASSWAPDGVYICGNNWYTGYGLKDDSGGLYLFVSQPGGAIDALTFSGRFIHVNKDGTILANSEIDKTLPSNWSSRFMISNTIEKTAALDSQNRPIVAWVRSLNQSNPATRELYVQKLDGSGNYLWTNTLKVASALNDYGIVSNFNDGAFIVYSLQGIILARNIYSSGQMDPVTLLITNESSSIRNLICVSGGSDHFWVTYTVGRPGGLTDLIAAKVTFSPSAGKTLYPIVAGANKIRFSGVPFTSACSDGNGGLVITWADDRNVGGTLNIYEQYINSAGQMYPAAGQKGKLIFGNAAGNQTSPSVDLIDSNNVLIACNSIESQTSFNIYGAKVSLTGSLAWLNRLSSSGTANFPSICADGNGNAFVAYLDGRNEPNINKAIGWNGYMVNNVATSEWTANLDVYAKKISGSGSDLWTQGDIPLCRAANIQIPSQTVNTEPGKAVSFWLDTRTSATDPANLTGTTTDEQNMIMGHSSVYAARIGDASAPMISLSKVNGFNYANGMFVLQDSLCTLEGAVAVSDSTFSSAHSALQIAWDGGAPGSLVFTPDTFYKQAGFSAQNTLTSGPHSFVISAVDDYGIPAAPLSGTLTATNEFMFLSDLLFDNSAVQCSTKPIISGKIMVTDQLSSMLDPTMLTFSAKWDSGTNYPVPSTDLTINKTSQTRATFTFHNPVALDAGPHVCLLTVKDIYNNIARATAYVTVPSPGEYFAAAASIQDGQLVLNIRSATQLPDSFTVSFFAPSGAVIRSVVADSSVRQTSSTSGYVSYKWPADEKFNDLAKGIYTGIFSTGEKIHLIKN